MASKSRPVYLPSKDFSILTVTKTILPAGEWYRLHYGSFEPIYFSRSDENRFSNSNSPYGALYVGSDPETCIMETYGDRIYGFRQNGAPVALSSSDWHSRHMVLLTVPTLQICDLTDRQTLQECSVDAGSLVFPDLTVPQSWGLAIMEHPSRFEGIRYLSRFTQAPCLAIFDHGAKAKIRRKLGYLPSLPEGDRVIQRFAIGLI